MMPHWDTGEIGATLAYRSTPAWDSVVGGKIQSINGVYTTRSLTAGQTSGILRPNTWGFAVGREIPPNAKILGFEVKITRHGVGIVDNQVQLFSNGSLVGNNKADTTTDWGATDQTITYGGPTDLWGWSSFTAPYTAATPHPSYLLADPYQFMVQIKAKNNSAVTSTAYIDCVTMKVYYQCYIIESTTADGYLKFRFSTGRPLYYDSLDNTSDDISSLNSSSTEATVDTAFGFFNTAPYIERRTVLNAFWCGNVNTVVDTTPNGSFGWWNFYINYQQGDSLTSADTVGWDNSTFTGGLFWETASEPLTDGAGYYSWDVTPYSKWLNKRTDVNNGYTNVVITATNTGNDTSPESTYILLDSKDKVGGYPMRLTIVTDEQDPLDTGCEINTTLTGS